MGVAPSAVGDVINSCCKPTPSGAEKVVGAAASAPVLETAQDTDAKGTQPDTHEETGGTDPDPSLQAIHTSPEKDAPADQDASADQDGSPHWDASTEQAVPVSNGNTAAVVQESHRPKRPSLKEMGITTCDLKEPRSKFPAPKDEELEEQAMRKEQADSAPAPGATQDTAGSPLTARSSDDGGPDRVADGQDTGEGTQETLDFKDGSTYTGQLVDDKRHGDGSYRSPNKQYRGQWIDDFRDGHGKQVWKDGRTYEGQFKKGQLHGMGKMEWKVSEGIMTYEGHYEENLKQGRGKFTWADGRMYDGEWHHGTRHGEGTFHSSWGVKKPGIWANDKLVRWLEKEHDGEEAHEPVSPQAREVVSPTPAPQSTPDEAPPSTDADVQKTPSLADGDVASAKTPPASPPDDEPRSVPSHPPPLPAPTEEPPASSASDEPLSLDQLLSAKKVKKQRQTSPGSREATQQSS